MAYNPLTPSQKQIIEGRGTEPPFTGEYDNFFRPGTFICRRCHSPLFLSQAKFEAGCGWPAFEGTIPNAVLELPDPDRTRIEIQCAHCHGHLGHVFRGEKITPHDTRHCVNSISLKFIPETQLLPEILLK